MRALVFALLAVGAAVPAPAQHAGHATDQPPRPPAEQRKTADPHTEHQPAEPAKPDPHAGHDMSREPAAPPPADERPGHDMTPGAAPPPPEAFAGPRHAAGTVFDPAVMVRAREDLRAEQGAIRTWWLMVDQIEARMRDGSDGYLWDAQGWYGGDLHKIWFKTEGDGGSLGEGPEEAEAQVLWSRGITPWFDFQAGVRYDLRPEPERAHLVVGLQGLVPYQFEVDAAAFLSDEGYLTARFEAEYDQRITQRLILQPRVELHLATQDVPEIGVGSGLTSAELGLRLRYEFVREFAPYIGVEYERAFGDTVDFARAAGEDGSGWEAVVGVRAWF